MYPDKTGAAYMPRKPHPSAPPTADHAQLVHRCAFCTRAETEVPNMIMVMGPTVMICGDCVLVAMSAVVEHVQQKLAPADEVQS